MLRQITKRISSGLIVIARGISPASDGACPAKPKIVLFISSSFSAAPASAIAVIAQSKSGNIQHDVGKRNFDKAPITAESIQL